MTLLKSRIRRDGLKQGEQAPTFRSAQVPSGEVNLIEYRGSYLLLVFSDPTCGPCNALLPSLEALHRRTPDIAVVMVSRGSPDDNHCKIREHGVTFPVALQ